MGGWYGIGQSAPSSEFAARGFARRNYSRSRSIGYLLNGQLQEKHLSACKVSQAYPGTQTYDSIMSSAP
ncbi:MAG: hypothetical protein ACLQVM_25780 [Terriglobia bacterium]